jgi:hypothetical protein
VNGGTSPPRATTRRYPRVFLSFLSIAAGVAIGAFGIYLGRIGFMSAGQYGTYGMSDTVSKLLCFACVIVAPVPLAGIALGISGVTMERKRKSALGVAFAVAVIVCKSIGGLVYMLGGFLFYAGSAFHY